ncbi:hypothetical protein Tco_1158404 [Tanacetum coccineum]
MHLGLWYPKRTGIETVVYADSDHAGDYVNRKSTSGICTFVGCCLTSGFSKKQTALAISTTEAEYVIAGTACQQALWTTNDVPASPARRPPLRARMRYSSQFHHGSLNSFEWRKITFGMITSMGIRHAKTLTLRGEAFKKTRENVRHVQVNHPPSPSLSKLSREDRERGIQFPKSPLKM